MSLISSPGSYLGSTGRLRALFGLSHSGHLLAQLLRPRRKGRSHFTRRLLAPVGLILLLLSFLGLVAPAASAGDGPTGFRYGTDTSCPTVTGGAPYQNSFYSTCNGGIFNLGGFFAAT